jgi:hypothetical protein
MVGYLAKELSKPLIKPLYKPHALLATNRGYPLIANQPVSLAILSPELMLNIVEYGASLALTFYILEEVYLLDEGYLVCPSSQHMPHKVPVPPPIGSPAAEMLNLCLALEQPAVGSVRSQDSSTRVT